MVDTVTDCVAAAARDTESGFCTKHLHKVDDDRINRISAGRRPDLKLSLKGIGTCICKIMG